VDLPDDVRKWRLTGCCGSAMRGRCMRGDRRVAGRCAGYV